VAAQLAAGLPDARMVVPSNLGHLPHSEDKILFREKLEHFLQQVSN
jgi:pimeloyl-ACP methyl ester carboxylesterase